MTARKDRTYGTVQTVGDFASGRAVWRIDCEPHVRTLLKRMFPRWEEGRAGVVELTDTPQVARDVEWFLTRWPMRMDRKTASRLAERAQQDRATEQAVMSILDGYEPPPSNGKLAFEPRDYQQQSADLTLATNRLLNSDQLGLGKTISGLLLTLDSRVLPLLVVTMAHLVDQWAEEVEEKFPGLTAHVLAKSRPYDLAEACGGRHPDVIVCNYHKLSGWSDHLAPVIGGVVFDEIHELRRVDSQKYRAAKHISELLHEKDGPRKGLTATPVLNYGDEVHHIVSLLDREALGSFREFTTEWCHKSRNKWLIREPEALSSYLRERGLFLRRTRKDVGRELPGLERIEHLLADVTQRDVDAHSADAADVALRILSGELDPLELGRASRDFDWRMRQATGIAKAPHVADLCRLLLDSEERIMLFGWHHEVYDVWMQHLADFSPVRFTGTETRLQKRVSAARFIGGDRLRRFKDRHARSLRHLDDRDLAESRVLIMSVRSGAGLDGLQGACQVGVFGELDWSPGWHEQAEGRFYRDGQQEPCMAVYAYANYGSDPVVLETLGIKKMQSEPLLDPGAAGFTPIDPDVDRIKEMARRTLAQRGIKLPSPRART